MLVVLVCVEFSASTKAITEKAPTREIIIIISLSPTRAFSWLKAATTAFTFKISIKTLC